MRYSAESLTLALRRVLIILVCVSGGGCADHVMRFDIDDADASQLAVGQILLREAATAKLLADLSKESTVSIATLPSRDVSLEAVVSGPVGSVEFIVDSNVTVEHFSPFTYPGDTNNTLIGFTAELGQHSVTATPYSDAGAQGQRGTSMTVAFSFVE